jgi:trans-aconitate 2-methyltransferase
MPWDPDRYDLFKRERTAPADDLLALLERRPGLRVIDLGAGTGELTRRLSDLLPDSTTLGVDSSPEMLARSASFERPSLRFELRSIEDVLRGAPDAPLWDIVFSNAALQWVPDHTQVMAAVFGLLEPGGQLLIQVPSNHGHPTHRLLAELAAREPYRTALGGFSRSSPVLTISAYAELFYALGASSIVALEKVYPHVLDGADALVEWMSGTALVPYLERLTEPHATDFASAYRELLRVRFPERPVFLGFQRIILSACRPSK